MKFIWMIFFLFLLPSYSKSSSVSTYKQLQDSILDFSLSGFNLLVQNSPSQDNILYSPFSVYSVLMMTHLGARSKTAHQICHTLGLCHLNSSTIHKAFGSLCKDLLSDSSLTDTLEIASGLFVQEGFNISDHYKYALRSFYSSTLEEVDFENDSLSSMNRVNDWVRHYTEGKIQAILHKNPSSLTKVMMVNAIHFRGQWKWQFDPLATEPYGFFFVTPHHRIQVPIMSGKMNVAFGHSSAIAASIIELPFSRNRMAMFLVLSDDPRKNVELNVTSLKALISTMRKREVNIRLPRFTIDLSPPLTGLMWTLGIKDIFSPTEADLSEIAPGLFVTDMVHRALIQVDEKGSIASATTITLVERIGNIDDNYFEANRPFIFMVIDKQSGAVLFIGRVANF